MADSDEKKSNETFKMGISIWLSICVFACLWFLSRFMTGRSQLRNNLHVIEDGLRRMQEEIERRQRENSIGYGENLEELMEQLKRRNEDTTEEKKEEEEATLLSNDGKEESQETSESVISDKKND